jgi:hypothetical protein
MQSGAGRRLTDRSDTAWLALWVTERGSLRVAAALTVAMTVRVPAPVKVPVSAASSSSTAVRSATVRQAVSLTTYMARSSLSCPVSRAARVWGISVTSALDMPSSRPPRCGDSPRASAICSAAPRPCSLGRFLPRSSAGREPRLACPGSACVPSSACSWRCRISKVTESLACCPASMLLMFSNAWVWSISPGLSAVRSAVRRARAAAIRSARAGRGVPGPAPIRARGGGVGEQNIGEQGLGKRVLRQLIVSNQGLGKGSSGETSSAYTKLGSSSYGNPSSANASNAMVPSGNAPKGSSASGTAAACRAPPCGAAAVSAEFPLPSMNTVCQGGQTFKGPIGHQMRPGFKSFLDPPENENQVAAQGVPSRQNALICHPAGHPTRKRPDKSTPAQTVIPGRGSTAVVLRTVERGHSGEN